MAQPAAAGNEGTQAAVETDNPHGVPDRVPAGVALESPVDASAPQHEGTDAQPSEAAPPEQQTELDPPKVGQFANSVW